ncbi:MAG TPA: hypothetical protein VFA33_06415 [Bryobacteraceae bacterium]|nr:hypothetical protein [Bryobacteraceae bacterium]
MKWIVVREFLPIALAFFLEDLEATHLLGGHVAPGNAKVGRIELQFEDPLEKATGDRVRSDVIQVVEAAMRAAVDGVLPGAAVRAGARRVGITNRALVPALTARYIVGIRATARTVRASIAQVILVDAPMDEEPERDRMRPLIRP